MPIKRPPLINKEIYHIVLRAVEGSKLFRDQKDYFRMIHNLFEFNDEKAATSNFRVDQYKNKTKSQKLTRTVLVNLEKEKEGKEPRIMLVEILAFCLMPNHIHLLVRQLRDGGISKFMRKIGAGYGNYYNQKYKRSGHIFQGKYRIIIIRDNEQIKTVFVYIHTNPAAILFPGWKEKGVKNLNKTIKFLENYKWSSYADYLGKKNFPSLTSREFLIKIMEGDNGCQHFTNSWIKFKRELGNLKDILID